VHSTFVVHHVERTSVRSSHPVSQSDAQEFQTVTELLDMGTGFEGNKNQIKINVLVCATVTYVKTRGPRELASTPVMKGNMAIRYQEVDQQRTNE
jgi:hypothetical protein